jgi:hypothetical protein
VSAREAVPPAARHTPGPWQVGFGATDFRWPQVESVDGIVARTYGSRDEEDARLISAAPDLLAACKAFVALRKCIGWNEGECDLFMGPAWHKETDAILKAEGGSK